MSPCRSCSTTNIACLKNLLHAGGNIEGKLQILILHLTSYSQKPTVLPCTDGFFCLTLPNEPTDPTDGAVSWVLERPNEMVLEHQQREIRSLLHTAQGNPVYDRPEEQYCNISCL
jgi:hypothetical protein